uniref:Uncharacterized protein n=1 Tax=Romanomermis culicivorax TaxID=13658 RepID=A0A915JZI1_ROMCU
MIVYNTDLVMQPIERESIGTNDQKLISRNLDRTNSHKLIKYCGVMLMNSVGFLNLNLTLVSVAPDQLRSKSPGEENSGTNNEDYYFEIDELFVAQILHAK